MRGLHRLQLSPAASAASDMRATMLDSVFRPLHAFAPFTGTPAAWVGAHEASFSGLMAPLPANVQLLTVHSQSPNTLLLRLAHNFELGDGPLAANVTVDVSSMFRGFTVVALEEVDAVASTPLTQLPRYTLRGDDGSVTHHPALPEPVLASGEGSLLVTLTPMQVRTFFATIAK